MQHHAAERIDGRPPCYGCGVKAAGNPTWPASAFCESCQPIDTRPVHGGACACARCLVQTGTLTNFDRHQRHHPKGHPEQGAFTGECIDPAEFGDLTQDENKVWQTRAGLVKRARDSERLRAARQAL